MELTHPDFVSTFKRSQHARRFNLWLPYFVSATKVRGSKYLFRYNGGEIVADLKKLDVVMFYGISGSIDVALLDAVATEGIVLLIHRRNMRHAITVLPDNLRPGEDILSPQIEARNNETVSAYLARTLTRARLQGMVPITQISATTLKKLASLRDVDAIRILAAAATKRHWDNVFKTIGGADVSRRASSPSSVNAALDACSVFITGILLRWIIFHRFSPAHGFLHRPTTYASLAYDLIEPYRCWIELAVISAAAKQPDTEKVLVAQAIKELQRLLDEEVYVPVTHQHVRRKSLLHGVVLALRDYLLGNMTRFVIPIEGKPKGGRPPNVSYVLPGTKAIKRTRRSATST